MNNCIYDLSKPCDPKTCVCDEDITEITDYSHLKKAVEFVSDDEINIVDIKPLRK